MLNDNISAETKRKLAEASDTPAEVLEQLSHDRDRTIRALVASNPNTSTEALLQLGIDFAEEITANPAFGLLMLEDIDSKFIQLCLGRSSNTSLEILEKLAANSDYSVREAVAKNPNTPPKCLLLLAEVGNEENDSIKKAAAFNPSLLFNNREELIKSRSFRIRVAVARDVNTPIDILIKLTEDRNFCVRAHIANNVNTPIDTLIKLAKDSAVDVRKCVANNVNTPIDTLIKLAKDNAADVRRYVASNVNTPIDISIKLVESSDLITRQEIAYNVNTSVNILIKLAADSTHDVRKYVAHNVNTPVNILKILAKDEFEAVRYQITQNQNTTLEVLQSLTTDKNQVVADAAQKRIAEQSIGAR